jgi:hypothetical protein
MVSVGLYSEIFRYFFHELGLLRLLAFQFKMPFIFSIPLGRHSRSTPCLSQNHWVCGLCPSSGMLHLLCRVPYQELTFSVKHAAFSSYLEFRTTDKVHIPSDSACHPPSSEHMFIFLKILFFCRTEFHTSHTTIELEDMPLSAVRHCLFTR